MAVSLEWGSNLPVPKLSNYGLKQNTGLLASQFSTGRSRARQLPNRTSTMTATWRLSDTDAEFFEAALEYEYLGVWFLLTAKLPRMNRLQQVEVLFIKDPRDSRKPVSGYTNRWEYSAELQVKTLPNLDKDIYALVMEMGTTFQNSTDLLDALEAMLN